MKIWSRYKTFHSQKWIWKWRNGGHFVQGGDELTWHGAAFHSTQILLYPGSHYDQTPFYREWSFLWELILVKRILKVFFIKLYHDGWNCYLLFTVNCEWHILSGNDVAIMSSCFMYSVSYVVYTYTHCMIICFCCVKLILNLSQSM